MKNIFLIFLSVFALTSYAQQPTMFQFIPTNSSGIMYGQAQIDGIPATSNDWIAAFDASGNCCGAAQIIMNSGIAYINLPIYGDDATTPTVDEGMNSNEDFTLKIFQYSSQQYIDYPSNTNVTSFSGWTNTNGSPLPMYSNPNDIYNFMNLSNVTLSLNLQMCENDNSVQLSGGSPLGGTYFGNGVSSGNFDPSIAGGGSHNIYYTVNNDTATSIISVYSLADASFVTTGPFCSNENGIVLNNVTSGGVYSGSGVVSGTFNPDMLGVGSYWVSYTLTDNNNCTQTIDQLFIVNSAPSVPTISQNNNILVCNSTGLNYQWLDVNLNPINGATSSTYQPTQSGEFYVQVQNDECSEISLKFNFIFTNINDFNEDISIINNQIVTGNLNDNYTIDIFDSLGRKLLSSSLKGNDSLNIDLVNNNLIFIKIHNNHRVITIKHLL